MARTSANFPGQIAKINRDEMEEWTGLKMSRDEDEDSCPLRWKHDASNQPNGTGVARIEGSELLLKASLRTDERCSRTLPCN